MYVQQQRALTLVLQILKADKKKLIQHTSRTMQL